MSTTLAPDKELRLGGEVLLPNPVVDGLPGLDKSIVGEGDLPLAAALARDGIGLGLAGDDLKHYQHKSTSRK